MKPGRAHAALLASAVSLMAWAAAAAQPDAAALRRGEQVYARCAACHAIDTHRTGPMHCGLFGRRAGTAVGYDSYSPAMRASALVWNERTLDEFLRDPGQRVPGTTMTYAGVKDAQERADLIAWLRMTTRPGKACKAPLAN